MAVGSLKSGYTPCRRHTLFDQVDLGGHYRIGIFFKISCLYPRPLLLVE